MFTNVDNKKSILDSKRPLNKEALDNLKKYFDVELTYNSNAIEGNTLTVTETKVILEDGITIGKGKTLREHLEVINHKEAIDYIDDIVSKDIDISERVVKDLHYIILKSINNKNAGKYRDTNVLISGSRHRPVEHILVAEKMQELIKWYKENKEKLHPIELAAEFHFRYVYIHPFVDGNGRSARLLMNLILMRNGYPISVIKNEDRDEYMKALEKASTIGDAKDFINIVANAVDKSLDTYLYIAQ
ncbi:Fic family protein [Clostridium botulinum]|uniref:Fic family protein n=1 Tax=Clostridium botulinum TaxID=1491 RepID=A0A0L9YA11_CLOBO|nr:Fic family protein [Clostridium botulinum]KAI3349492.1 Fic family protein [Clostridium botulinum]KOM88605.1 cell filamentation protein Fic [Clostridium botulinum]KOR57442.1 cell filamentation protein Fic [Clostridium botulinum]MBN1048895.1 Fic family protein [Clostridium botulinum]MBN1077896.1 Fic family protein [Clostridium botulinum]